DIDESRGEVEEPDEAPRLAAALAGQVGADVSELEGVENADLKAQHDSALEVYVPFVLDGRVVGAFEIYQDLAPCRRIRPLGWGAVRGGLALLRLSLLAVVRGAAVLIRRQQADAAAQEVRYRVLVEHLPVIAYTAALDDTSSTLYVSPQLEAILG